MKEFQIDRKEEGKLRQEQLVNLYKTTIKSGYMAYYNYKALYKHLTAEQNKNIIQDIMKSKLYQCQWLIDIYMSISNEKYPVQEYQCKKTLRITEMFSEACNYADTLNHLYGSTPEMSFKLKLIQIINEQQNSLLKLIYLQSIIGSSWETNHK